LKLLANSACEGFSSGIGVGGALLCLRRVTGDEYGVGCDAVAGRSGLRVVEHKKSATDAVRVVTPTAGIAASGTDAQPGGTPRVVPSRDPGRGVPALASNACPAERPGSRQRATLPPVWQMPSTTASPASDLSGVGELVDYRDRRMTLGLAATKRRRRQGRTSTPWQSGQTGLSVPLVPAAGGGVSTPECDFGFVLRARLHNFIKSWCPSKLRRVARCAGVAPEPPSLTRNAGPEPHRTPLVPRAPQLLLQAPTGE
jgi:hypothetical protein